MLSSLGTKRLGVTYVPATDTDAQLIQSYKDQGATSLPAYLVRVKPLVRLDGVTVASGPVITMGQTQYWDATLIDPQGLTTGTESFTAIAGDEIVFGVNGNGTTLAAVQNRLAAMPSNTPAENLHQVALHYWMELDLFDGFAAKANGVHVQRLPSVGLFSSPLSVSYFFGIPRSGNYKGRIMDVKRVLMAVADGTERERFTFASQSGIQGSYLEGTVFDQLFHKMQGKSVSAAQLLAESNQRGTRIYSITQDNLATVLPVLSVSPDVKNDIANAVHAGKVAVVPQNELSYGSYQGVGYILQDPQTGAAAYLIDGGLHGAASSACQSSVSPLQGVISAGIAAIIAAAMAQAALSGISITVGSTVTAGGALTLFPAVVISGPIVAFVAFTVLFIMAVYLFQMEMQLLLATGQGYSSEDECTCGAHYGRCVNSGWDRPIGTWGKGLCAACLDVCTANGGNAAGNWPSAIPTFPGGPVDVSLSCDYPGSH